MWSRKGIFEMRFQGQEGSSHVLNWETALQTGNSKYKGPEVGMNLECLRIRQKACVAASSELRL